mgnify:FL=1
MNELEKKETIARILAATSILANTNNVHIAKLADLIGNDMAKLIPTMLDDVVGNELFELILKHQAWLAKEIPTVKAEEPRIHLIN